MSDAPSQGKPSSGITGRKRIEVTDDLCEAAATTIMEAFIDPMNKFSDEVWVTRHDNLTEFLCKVFGSNGYKNHN